jgi:hypothetical protein
MHPCLPDCAQLAKALRAVAQEHRDSRVSVLLYADGFWELSCLSPDWFAEQLAAGRMVLANACWHGLLHRSTDLARDVRDALKTAAREAWPTKKRRKKCHEQL